MISPEAPRNQPEVEQLISDKVIKSVITKILDELIYSGTFKHHFKNQHDLKSQAKLHESPLVVCLPRLTRA